MYVFTEKKSSQGTYDNMVSYSPCCNRRLQLHCKSSPHHTLAGRCHCSTPPLYLRSNSHHQCTSRWNCPTEHPHCCKALLELELNIERSKTRYLLQLNKSTKLALCGYLECSGLQPGTFHSDSSLLLHY